MEPAEEKVRWHDVAQMPRLGHGVEFHYGDELGPCVAFLEGYYWRRESQQASTVYVLTPQSKAMPDGVKMPADIVAEVKNAITYFLTHPKAQMHGHITDNVWAFFNG